MHRVLVLGAGKIGSLIAVLLAKTHYTVHLVDKQNKLTDSNDEVFSRLVHFAQLDVMNDSALEKYVKQHGITTLISCLPYYCNLALAKTAKALKLNYFDLTEDVHVASEIEKLAKGENKIFMPQCGIAPGFISIVTHHLIKRFDEIKAVLMRVGALPLHPNNVLKYALTWSTDGLINEYGNSCHGIIDGEMVTLQPLEGLETIEIDGLLYEAFNTSGGLGTLAKSCKGKLHTMNYKTLRYPGHCENMRLLMNDLKLNEDRDTLKRILENAIPRTTEDVVIIYVAVNGNINGEFIEETYVKKLYPAKLADKEWTAIQMTTAKGACAVIDMTLNDPAKYHGFVLQESIDFQEFIRNRFGEYYAQNES